ncbi:50S ribosomal protein L18 [Cytophagales bacterium LB-30]|uniref:Large ribosomal subunit protein uL18 n=1 Tax=Shiella aurantiaca TaxID=3058365 RepID=A0ABT8F785_9BACT|nr:50S ribosomal protein L18 [Shiella aurantiaca]MDN4166320.1 50S ribosomal protein L18 [Shiella aurantiaca]
MALNKLQKRTRIRMGIRNKISGTAEKPRLSVFKSNTGIYAQLIDDIKGHTLAFASSREIAKDATANVGISANVGKKLAERAKAQGIEVVVFDRGGYRYHGRVKALADGAREGGLKF